MKRNVFLPLFLLLILFAFAILGVVFISRFLNYSLIMRSSLEITLLITFFIFLIISRSPISKTKGVVLSIVVTVFGISYALIALVFALTYGIISHNMILTYIFVAIPVVLAVLSYIVKSRNMRLKITLAFASLYVCILSISASGDYAGRLIGFRQLSIIHLIIVILFILVASLFAGKSAIKEEAKPQASVLNNDVKTLDEKMDEDQKFTPKTWEENGMTFRNYE